MRPRINKFGVIKFKDLQNYLYDNYVFGLTVYDGGDTLTYHYIMMFRSTREKPEELDITVSRTSKLVLSATGTKHGKFNNVKELLAYTKR